MAALVLARAGARVRLIDRARFPRDKLCGDTVNPGSLAILDGVGLGDAVRARGLAVRGMIVTGGGARVATTYPRGITGVAVSRRDLDLLLVEHAVAAGASFDEGVRASGAVMSPDGSRVAGVRITCGAREHALQARVVIVAEGRASRLASGLGLSRFARAPRRWAFGAYFDGVDRLTEYGEMHIRSRGYVGVAPLPGGIANVCAVYEAADGEGAPRLDQDRVLAAALRGDPVMRERFGRARQISPVSVLGPLAVDSRRAGCPGALLAGDAAGFVDPMTGDGLRFALRGGELAATAALDELTSGVSSHVGLWQARTREFAGKWRLNRALRLLVGSPGAVRAAAALARYWPAPIAYLTCAAGDVHLAARSGAA
jgi:flavin-dependent dehydrogenase